MDLLNKTPSIQRAYFQVHLSVLLYGFTAILGFLIKLPPITLVWYRLLIAVAGLIFLPGTLEQIRQLSRKSLLKLSGIGLIVATHWVLFFAGIKYSNITIATSLLATTTLFVSILEPIFLKKKIKGFEVILGLLIIPGVYLIFFFTDFTQIWGMIFAVLAALAAAIFGVLNKTVVDKHPPMAMTFVELGSGFIGISILMPFLYLNEPDAEFLPSWTDLGYLLLLGLICTSFAYVITLNALKRLSTFSVNLAINLEPIYSAVLAVVLFNEQKDITLGTYVGAGIIIFAVFLHPIVNRIAARRNRQKVASSD